MNWKYNPRKPLPAKDLTKLTAFLDSLFSVLGVFGAQLDGDDGYANVTVAIEGYRLVWEGDAVTTRGVNVENENGVILGVLELTNGS